jgi:hypothetical protein
MKPIRIENAIDNKIISNLNSGKELIDIYNMLEQTINNFIIRDDFMDVDEIFLKSNWDNIHFKKRYTSYYVVYTKKRKSDIMWLIVNRQEFKKLSNVKLFMLIRLRDKLQHATS